MTRRHYRIVADVLRAFKSAEDCGWVLYHRRTQAIVVSLAVAFAQDNPRFNPATFIAACGVSDYDSSWITQLRGPIVHKRRSHTS